MRSLYVPQASRLQSAVQTHIRASCYFSPAACLRGSSCPRAMPAISLDRIGPTFRSPIQPRILFGPFRHPPANRSQETPPAASSLTSAHPNLLPPANTRAAANDMPNYMTNTQAVIWQGV